MRESLREHFENLARAQAQCQDHASKLNYGAALEYAKQVLSAGSKLHARLGSLLLDQEDAKFIASAEHMLADARQKYPLPLEGDQPLPFVEPPAARPKRTRKPKA